MQAISASPCCKAGWQPRDVPDRRGCNWRPSDRYGIGRDAVDLARHLRARGWRALVASPGGQLERELAAAGGTHLPLPLDADGRFATWRNRRQAGPHHPCASRVLGPCPWTAADGERGAAAARAAIPLIATVHDAR